MKTYNSALGICIPTYKRPEQLFYSVQSIISAASTFDIPIFISDDSGDETNHEVISSLKSLYGNIIYSRNRNNLGIDRNILKSIDICDCRYAWPIGEDDRMVPGAVAEVLRVIDAERNAPSFIYANYASVDETVSFIVKEHSLNLKEDGIQSPRYFLERFSWSIGFIGACVINKRLWSTVSQETYIGTYFAHVGIIMEYLQKKQLYLIANPLVLNRCGTPKDFSWKDSTFNVVKGWQELMGRLESIYGDTSCRQAVSVFEGAHGLNTLQFLAYLRADDVFNRLTYHKAIAKNNKGFGFRKMAWIIAVTSPRLFQLSRSILMRIRRPRGRRKLKALMGR